MVSQSIVRFYLRGLNQLCLVLLLGLVLNACNSNSGSKSSELEIPDSENIQDSTSEEGLKEVDKRHAKLPYYDDFQQVFLMAMISNMSGSYAMLKNTDSRSVKAVEKKFEENIQLVFDSVCTKRKMIKGTNEWRIVWGPEVLVAPQNIHEVNGEQIASSTHAMFVANRGGRYVVAVAGANSPSSVGSESGISLNEITQSINARHLKQRNVRYIHGIPFPDASLGQEQVEWKYRNYEDDGEYHIRVRKDVMNGLDHLLHLESKGNTLTEFLATVTEQDSITVVGHGFGGALTMGLGLALFDSTTSLEGAESLHKVRHFIYPTAAPDIGNEQFVESVSQVFPTLAYKPIPAYHQINQKIWNTLDIIPYAWSAEYLGEMKNLYAGHLEIPSFLEAISDASSNDPGGIHTLDPTTVGQFTGTFVKTESIPGFKCGCEGTNKESEEVACLYLAQVFYQHITAYYEHFEIDSSVMVPPQVIPCAAAKGF